MNVQRSAHHRACLTTMIRAIVSLFLAMPWSGAVVAGTLSNVPLSMRDGVPPNVMFALSVEFPTANTAAYQGISDYSANSEYLGYFDPNKCYDYDAVKQWFAPVRLADNHACSGKWSGNFLNWATMTGLDEFRFAMTGGHRYRDTATETVIERTWQSGQGGTSNFPNKTFTEGGSATPYPIGTSLTLNNVGSTTGVSGIQMTVSTSRTDTAICTAPSVVGTTFSCGTLTLQVSGAAAACEAWSGDGTANAPYQCMRFGNIAGEVPTGSRVVATSTAAISRDNTVTCDAPPDNLQTSPCTISTKSDLQGSCTAWTGAGTVASPYSCASFGTFGSDASFASNTASDRREFTATVDGPPASVTANCSVSGRGQNATVSCPIGNNETAVCSTFSVRAGSNYCTGFSLPGGKRFVSASFDRSRTTNWRGSSFYTGYTISWIPIQTVTRSYFRSYGGSQSGSYVYVSSYSLSFGGSGNFSIRAKVCDSAVGLEANCRKFGSSWKPVGTIQENGNAMRFGVMSYFNATDVDNAVLRAQMKSVAPLMPSGGNLVDNPGKEWDNSTGILTVNPDPSIARGSYSGAAANSGVINYINQFGRQAKNYKTYDDVGKLYYEALRYLRGMTPTTAFYNGATSANADGFPIITGWTDPIQNSCQKNFIVVIGDTHTWCDKRLPGGSYVNQGNSVCSSYTDKNGNFHSKDTGALPNGDTLNVTTQTGSVGTLEDLAGLPTAVASYGSFNGGGFGMAGLAHWAAKSDIRSDMDGSQHAETLLIDVQEYKDCGYQSPFWLAAKYGIPDSYDASGTWKSRDNPATASLSLPPAACGAQDGKKTPPDYNDAGGIVQWPRNLLRGGDPASMVASVRGALASIVARSGIETALSQSANRLDNRQGAYLYRAAYRSTGWQGELEAFGIDTAGRIITGAGWTASANLPAPSNRNIYSFNDGVAGTSTAGTGQRRGFAFTAANFPAAFSPAQRDALNRAPDGTVDNFGADRVDWLRGDRTNESGASASSRGWRSRQSLLGDIVNSNPVFVAAPSNVAGSRDFAIAHANRTPAVYVGANDGMLHAFDASYQIDDNGQPRKTSTSGRELFAYVPSSVYRNINALMDPSYAHKYFVDGSPAVADACFGNTAGTVCTDNWKSVLVGGLNAGGQGIYALDVTDPKSFDASKVLWEFTDRDDPDLGYTFGTPLVRRLNNEKWAVIFGSGFNNTDSDDSVSSSGKAFLFVLYLDGPGNGNRWLLNSNYFKIELSSQAAEGTTPLNPPNGVSSLVDLDRNGDGRTDVVYAGDRRGNVWKVDLSSKTAPTTSASTWGSALNEGGSAAPLFTATAPPAGANAAPAAQQILRGMEVVRHPRGGFMLLFGTGAWVDTEDYADTTVQSFYGIWDRDDGSVVTRANLQNQKIVATVDASGTPCTAGTAGCMAIVSRCTPNYVGVQGSDPLCPADIANAGPTAGTAGTTSSTSASPSITPSAAATMQQGWVFDLASTGERIRSTAPLVNGRIVTFTTLSPAPGSCDIGANGAEFNLDWLTGGGPRQPVYVLSGNTTGMLNISLSGGTSTVNVRAAPAGKWLASGASDNFVRLRAFDDEGGANADGAGSAGVRCIGAACNDAGRPYIPGWGFVADLRSPTDRTSRPIDFAFDSSIKSDGRYQNGQFGRLSWRQLDRE